MRGRWFRQYESSMDDPKVQMLSDWQYRAWHTLLCFASKHGGAFTDDIEILAFVLRKPAGKVRDTMQALVSARLFEKASDGYRPHKWDEFQYKSDSPNQRVAAFRKRNCNVTSNVTVTPSVTPPDTEQIQSRAEKKESRAPASAVASKPVSPRATRWPSDKAVPTAWFPPILDRFRELGRAPPDLLLEAVKFANYWAGKSGKDATKLDWQKTFLNWCLNARTDQRNGFDTQNHKPSLSGRLAAVDAAVAALERAGDGQPAPGPAQPRDDIGRQFGSRGSLDIDGDAREIFPGLPATG